MKKMEDLRIRRTHKLLIDALRSLLEEKDFEDIHVKDICELAMVHRTTFYKHFEDKYQLMSFALKELYSDFQEKLLIAYPFQTPKEYYLHVLDLTLTYLSETPKLYKLLFAAHQNASLMAVIHDFFLNDIQSKLEESVKKGMVSFTIPIPIISEFYTVSIINLSKWWFANGKSPAKETFIHYIDLLMDGNSYISPKTN